jgi:hypothetical protein
MRALYDIEKQFIEVLVHHSNRGLIPSIASLVDGILGNTDVYLDFQNRLVELRFDVSIYSQGVLTETARNLSAELVTVVNLLTYLESNGYVNTYLEAQPGPHQRFGRLIQGNQFISFTIPDKKLTDLLLDYSLKSILVGEPLLEFVKDDFRTKDDIAFIKNFKLAIGSLVVSVLIGLAGLVFNYVSLSPTAIDQSSINQITAPLKKTLASDSLFKKEISRLIYSLTNDTLMVKDAQPKEKAIKLTTD